MCYKLYTREMCWYRRQWWLYVFLGWCCYIYITQTNWSAMSAGRFTSVVDGSSGCHEQEVVCRRKWLGFILYAESLIDRAIDK